MKEISLKEFSINTYKYINDLPLLITKNNKPYAKVTVATKDTTQVATSGEKEDRVATAKCVVKTCQTKGSFYNAKINGKKHFVCGKDTVAVRNQVVEGGGTFETIMEPI